MKIYLVGGAIRDQLLGITHPAEKDYVVVGATVHDMLQKGFRQVGKDFPVFLHPETHEEYALARTERKVGKGYTGFTFNTDPTVTLEEDLKRRDITINAMARPLEGGDLIDPYNGQADLRNKLLRHVSPAFAEDPVRILRVARFAARFNFEVHPDTLKLMQSMVEQGEVDALVAERVWKELERALLEKYPEKFFEVLESSGAKAILFPNINSSGIKALEQASHLKYSGEVRFAALLHNLNENEVKQLCERYRVPGDYRDLALLVCKYLDKYHAISDLTAEGILDLLLKLDAFRREGRFINFLRVCEISSKTLFLNTKIDTSASTFLQNCYQAAKNIDLKESLTAQNGKEIAEKIKIARCNAIRHVIMKVKRL